jgi:intracellular septation protein A
MRTNPPGPKILTAIAVFFVIIGAINLLISNKQVIEMGAYHKLSNVLAIGLLIIGITILIIRITSNYKGKAPTR